MKKLFLLLGFTSLLVVGQSQAAQTFNVEDGTLVQANVSASGMTRFAMKGGAKITSISGDKAYMDYEKDEGKGEVYIKPKTKFGSAFSFFLSDDTGATYTISAKPMEIPSQVVFLVPTGKPIVKKSAPHKDYPHVKATKELMKAMISGNQSSDEYHIIITSNEVSMWDEASIKRIRVYGGYKLEGEIYTLKNESKKVMRLHESEFFGIHNTTSAVSVLDMELQPGQLTFVYVIHSI